MAAQRQNFARLIDRKQFAEHVPPDSRLVVGLSGGADSVALLRGLVELRSSHELSLFAAHVNHGTRAACVEDERFVGELCGELDVPLFVHRLDGVPGRSGGSLEAFWREQRYEFFGKVMQETGAHFLALGHTADDLAESFLFHLTRGSGVDGLVFSFLKESHGLKVVRPLWKTRRVDIEESLNSVGLEWREDESNLDLKFSRNRMRHRVLPELNLINPRAVEAIVALSEDLRELQESVTKEVGGGLQQITVSKLRDLGLSREVARLVRELCIAKGAAAMDRRQTQQAVNMIQHCKTGTVALPGSMTLVIDQQQVWVFAGEDPTDRELAVARAAKAGMLVAELAEPVVVAGDTQVSLLDGSRAVVTKLDDGHGLHLRNRRAGDRVGSVPLKKVLINAGVPWYFRDFVVLVANEKDEIVGALDGAAAGVGGWIARHLGFELKLDVQREAAHDLPDQAV